MSISKEVFEGLIEYPRQYKLMEKVLVFLKEHPDKAYSIYDICDELKTREASTRSAMRGIKTGDRVLKRIIGKTIFFMHKENKK